MELNPIGWLRHVQREVDGLSAAAVAVASVLAMRSNRVGECWPGRGLLAAESGASARHVSRVLRELQQVGLLLVERQTNRLGYKVANRYVLAVGGVRITDAYVTDPTARPKGQTEPLGDESLSDISTPPRGHHVPTIRKRSTQQKNPTTPQPPKRGGRKPRTKSKPIEQLAEELEHQETR